MKSNSMNKLMIKNIYMDRLERGADLIASLTNIAISKGIMIGMIRGIGALSKAKLLSYDFEAKKYREIIFNKEMEILNFSGNITVKDDLPFIHAHVTLADSKGRAFGGHIATGSEVLVMEYIIYEFEGPRLSRIFDEETGLFLWKKR